MWRFEEDSRPLLSYEFVEPRLAFWAARGWKPEKDELIGGEATYRKQCRDRAGARNRDDANSARPGGLDERAAWVGDTRRARVGHERDRLAPLQSRHQSRRL